MVDRVVTCRAHNTLHHDFFISYRVSADAQVARYIYDILQLAGASVFWDQRCLPLGEKWQPYFLKYLLNAKVIVLLLSEASLKNVETAHLYEDNMLLEIERALDLKDKGQAEVIPVFLPSVNAQKELSFFKAFGAHRFPREYHCSNLSSRRKRETIQDTIKTVFAYNGMIVRFDTEDHSLLQAKVHADILPLLGRGKSLAPAPVTPPAVAPARPLALAAVANPVIWETVRPGGPIPGSPFLAAKQICGKRLYSIKANINSMVHPGQLSSDGIAAIPYGNYGVFPSEYDVLMPPRHGRFTWYPTSYNRVPANAIVAGSDHGNNPLYIARVFYEGESYVGKAGPHLQGGKGCAAFVVDGKEVGLWDFEVLLFED